MKERRDFIKKGLLLTGILAFNKSPLFGNNLDTLTNHNGDDESYWKLVKRQFPLQSDKIYLNNGTMGPSPYPVINAIQKDMMDIETSGRYGGNEDLAIEALSRFLSTKKEEISLTRNVTEGINIIASGLNLKKGDEVIMTQHEHVGHAGPWLNKAYTDGIVIKTFLLGKTAEETIDNLKKAITNKTKVISVPHIPCTIGQILPVKAICEIAREKNIFSFIDGAHPPGMLALSISDLNCDFYAGCCHKWMLGPKGTGFLYVAENMRDQLKVLYGGAGVDTGWDMLINPPSMKGYAENGHRFFYGTQNAASFKGIAAAIEFQETIGVAKIEKRVKQLSTYLQENLLAMGTTIDMLTPTESISRGAQIAFKIKDKDMAELQKKGYEKKIITRFVPENNINCLRVSTHIYNNFDEVDQFLELTERFIKS
ncbi:MAG: aminotransferase class V-fold PLP-dependent enzyme [Bacteroidota bacterium]|nr:aminotransferase class V-fold PLP-dependent enzyme [Bacteroidota bacterium]